MEHKCVLLRFTRGKGSTLESFCVSGALGSEAKSVCVQSEHGETYTEIETACSAPTYHLTNEAFLSASVPFRRHKEARTLRVQKRKM